MMPCLQCELPRILEETMPPDSGFVDPIEQAFLDGQIDGPTAELAYLLLVARKHQFQPIRYPSCYPKREWAH